MHGSVGASGVSTVSEHRPTGHVCGFLLRSEWTAKHADVRLRWEDPAEYVQMVKAAETAMNKDAALSRTLGNTDVQGLAHAIKVYTEPGKLGFYDRILDPFRERQVVSIGTRS